VPPAGWTGGECDRQPPLAAESATEPHPGLTLTRRTQTAQVTGNQHRNLGRGRGIGTQRSPGAALPNLHRTFRPLVHAQDRQTRRAAQARQGSLERIEIVPERVEPGVQVQNQLALPGPALALEAREPTQGSDAGAGRHEPREVDAVALGRRPQGRVQKRPETGPGDERGRRPQTLNRGFGVRVLVSARGRRGDGRDDTALGEGVFAALLRPVFQGAAADHGGRGRDAVRRNDVGRARVCRRLRETQSAGEPHQAGVVQAGRPADQVGPAQGGMTHGSSRRAGRRGRRPRNGRRLGHAPRAPVLSSAKRSMRRNSAVWAASSGPRAVTSARRMSRYSA